MTIKNEMGDIGESYVVRFFGPKFVLSADKYDSEKDGLYDNVLTVEVKTLTMMFNGEEFILPANQYAKATSVDALIVNEIPLHAKDGVQGYLVPNNKLLQLEWRFIDGKKERFVIIKKANLLPLYKIECEPSVERLVELADSLSEFRRNKKSNTSNLAVIEYDPPKINDEFYSLDLPKNYNGDTISNIFSSHYKTLHTSWAKSGKRLKIVDGDKVVTIIESYNNIMKNNKIAYVIKSYNKMWLPTGLLAKAGLMKLYDHRFKKTEKVGDIAVVSYP